MKNTRINLITTSVLDPYFSTAIRIPSLGLTIVQTPFINAKFAEHSRQSVKGPIGGKIALIKTGNYSDNSDEWSVALNLAIRAARAGREVLLSHLGRLQHVEEKFQAGLVSEADKESEKIIFQELRKSFPSDEYLGEESAALDMTKVQAAKNARRWVVDPLDGTTNYVHQFPVFCISIGLEVNGETQVAVIDVPMMGETYTAIRGRGAYVNGKKISVSKTQNLKDSLLATGFIADHLPTLEEQIRIFSRVVKECRGVRRAGAAAYDLCMVARGVFDGYWEKNLKPWDSSAGLLLVEEAGGVVTTYDGEKYSPYKDSILSGNPAIHALLLKKMQSSLV